MKRTYYQGILVGAGALKTALDNKDRKEARKVFDDTTARFNTLYGSDAEWFMQTACRFATSPAQLVTDPVLRSTFVTERRMATQINDEVTND